LGLSEPLKIEEKFKELRARKRRDDKQGAMDAADAARERIKALKEELKAEKNALEETRKRLKKNREAEKEKNKESNDGEYTIENSAAKYQEISHGASVGGFSQRGISAQTGIQKKLIDVNERTAKATEKIQVLMERAGSFAFI